MPRPRKKPQLPDRGDTTPERLIRAGEDTFTDDQRRRWMRDCPIERALSRKAITSSQYLAAVKYRVHWYRGGMAGQIGSIDMEGSAHHANVANFGHMARNELQAHDRDIYREASQSVGQMGQAVLEAIVCQEMPFYVWGSLLGWKTKSDAIVAATQQLRDALLVLCRIWRI